MRSGYPLAEAISYLRYGTDGGRPSCHGLRPLASGGSYIRELEALPLEQKRLPGGLSQRIREAVSEVQAARWLPFPNLRHALIAPRACSDVTGANSIGARSTNRSSSCPPAVPARLSTTIVASRKLTMDIRQREPPLSPSRIAPRPVPQTRQPGRPTCPRSLRQAVFAIQKVAVFDGQRTVAQKPCAPLSCGVQFPYAGLDTALASLSFKPLPERYGDRACHGLAGELRQFAGKAADLFVLDVEAHSSRRRVEVCCANLPYHRSLSRSSAGGIRLISRRAARPRPSSKQPPTRIFGYAAGRPASLAARRASTWRPEGSYYLTLSDYLKTQSEGIPPPS